MSCEYPEPGTPGVYDDVTFGIALLVCSATFGAFGATRFLARVATFFVTITAASRATQPWTFGAQVGCAVSTVWLKLRDIGPIAWTLLVSADSAVPDPPPT
jgi:hypothetical protein